MWLWANGVTRREWTLGAAAVLVVAVAGVWAWRDWRSDAQPGATAQAARAAVAGSSGLMMPVAGVDGADLVDTYAHARGAGRTHDAIDIVAPRGSRVVAVTDGTVLRLFLSDRGGITLYHLARDGRTLYYYAHLDRYADGMAAGRALRQGDVIGYVGDSGNAVPGNHHLHFEISTVVDASRSWSGVAQNPYPLLRQAIPAR